MEQREKHQIEYVRVTDAGGRPSVILNQKHVESCIDFLRKRHPKVEIGQLEPIDGGNQGQLLHFAAGTPLQAAIDAIADWKDWFASDLRQLLSRLNELKNEFDWTSHPEATLLVSQTEIKDFRKGDETVWAKEN